jgi:hypothetical protein
MSLDPETLGLVTALRIELHAWWCTDDLIKEGLVGLLVAHAEAHPSMRQALVAVLAGLRRARAESSGLTLPDLVAATLGAIDEEIASQVRRSKESAGDIARLINTRRANREGLES